MTVCNRRRLMRAFGKLSDGRSGKPKSHWQNTHERAVAIRILVTASSILGTDTVFYAQQRVRRRHADIESLSVRCPVRVSEPAHETRAHVRYVELSRNEALNGTQQHRRIIRPCSSRLMMGAITTHPSDRISLYSCPFLEFNRNAQCVAHHSTPKPAKNLVA